MATLNKLNNWYQIDFKIEGSAKMTLQKIAKLIYALKRQTLINKWFYLFENTNIRIRFNSTKPSDLDAVISELAQQFGLVGVPEKPFEPYTESTDMFASLAIVETFANVMSELSEFTIQRFENKVHFSNYRLVERLSHCIFNNVYGLPTEEYFLLKRILERIGGNLDNLNDNPEQTVLDDSLKISTTQEITIKITALKVPTK